MKRFCLAEAYTSFHSITSLPTFNHHPSDPSPLHTSILSLLTAPDGSFSIHLLSTIAGRHSQSTFSHAIFTYLHQTLLSAPLPPSTHARLRHTAAPLASTLFGAYYLPISSTLDHHAVALLYLSRLGVPIPDLPSPPSTACTLGCAAHRHRYPPNLLLLSPHAIHPMSCARSRPSRHRRHDGLLRIIALAIQRWLKVECSTTERLHSSSASGKKVDLVVTSYDLHPPHTAFDATVSVPLLPSHLASAAQDASILFSDLPPSQRERRSKNTSLAALTSNAPSAP